MTSARERREKRQALLRKAERLDVLNPQLHGRLGQLFGVVRVVNKGQVLDGETKNLALGAGEQRLRFVTRCPGEYYAVNCPFCQESRKRLFVSYMFGKYEGDQFPGRKRPKLARPLTFLAVCYNDTHCLDDIQNRHHLMEMLEEKYKPLVELRVAQGVRSRALTEPWVPGPIQKLTALPATHRANAYILGRGFEPERLERFWEVGYCPRAQDFLAAQRIYVPYYFDGELRGWQCRMPEDLPKHVKFPPKYYSMPGLSKQSMLFSYDEARRWHTGVIVEGSFDVFGFGPPAAATFGDHISYRQKELIADAWKDGSVVILLDPAEMKKERMQETVEELRSKNFLGKGRVAAVTLPAGKDPGSLDRGWMRDYVEQKAKKQGVKVRYELKE